MTRRGKYQTLTQALQELERTDPEVRKAAEAYDKTVKEDSSEEAR